MIPLGVLASARHASGGAPSYAYIGEVGIQAVVSSRTFTGVAIGTAASNRTLIIAAHSRGTSGRLASTLTVAGVSATKHAELVDGSVSVQIWTAAVPTGTTGDIALTYAGTSESQAVEVWAAYGTLTYSTSGTSGVAGASVTLTAPNDCLSVSAITSVAGTGYGTAYTGLTEDYRSPSTDYTTRAAASGQPAAGSHNVAVPGSSNGQSTVVVDFTLT